MIDFDDIEEVADERAAAGDDLDEAARAALSCPVSKRGGAGEDLSLDELLGRSAQVTAASGLAEDEEQPGRGAAGTGAAKAKRRDLCELDTAVRYGEPLGREQDHSRMDASGDEPDVASLYSRSLGAKPGAAGKPAKSDGKSKRLSLCELSPAWSPEVPSGAGRQEDVEPHSFNEPLGCPGLLTETTAAEAPSTREDSSVDGADDAEAAAPALEPAKPEPASAATPSAPVAADACEWPARPDEAHFRILDAVLPMHLPHEGVTPQEVMKVWEEDWGVAYAHTLRFQSSESSSKRWLNPREDAVPCSPTVVRLEGKAGVLNALALSMRQHDERLKTRSGADAARRRLSGAQSSSAAFGPRFRPAATAKRQAAPGRGRGTPFSRKIVSLRGED